MRTQAERFWAKVEKTDSCWLWTGSRSEKGYGRVNIRGVNQHAHRVAYESVMGPVPAGLQLDHLCRVRHCVNPAHLEAVTHRENVLRGESFSAQNARRTHCKHGHPLNASNIYASSARRGVRQCRTCTKARAMEQWRREKEGAA